MWPLVPTNLFPLSTSLCFTFLCVHDYCAQHVEKPDDFEIQYAREVPERLVSKDQKRYNSQLCSLNIRITIVATKFSSPEPFYQRLYFVSLTKRTGPVDKNEEPKWQYDVTRQNEVTMPLSSLLYLCSYPLCPCFVFLSRFLSPSPLV